MLGDDPLKNVKTEEKVRHEPSNTLFMEFYPRQLFQKKGRWAHPINRRIKTINVFRNTPVDYSPSFDT